MPNACRACIIAAALNAIACVASVSAARPQSIVEAVDAIAHEAVESGAAVGLSVAVAEGDRVLLAKGYGHADLESRVPATAETVYRIGSITKQFTATAVLLLVEDGKIGLDEPLTKYLPDYPTQGNTVAIRHLLQHTSGIQSFTDLPSYRRMMSRDVSHDDILDRFQDEPFQFTPGEKYRYCNSGYYLLGVIIERVSGVSYEEFLQQRVFSPIELQQTYYDRHARVIPHRRRGYSRWGGKLTNARFLNMKQPFAAGALASTVEDLIAWQRALRSHRLLTAESYRMMTTPGTLASGKSINYGFGTVLRRIDGRRTVGHGGGINGFRSWLTYYPETDHTIVVLANSENAQPALISRRIADHLFGKSPAAKPE